MKARESLTSLRALGRSRLIILGIITSGHSFVHWYMEIFPVILPSLKTGLGLNNVELGGLMTARQLVGGALTLPSGILADSWVRHRPLLLATAPVFMGTGYLLIGIIPTFAWALLGVSLVGLGNAVWHPAAVASLSSRFPEHRATAIAIHGMAASISNTVTPLIVGALLVYFHWTHIFEVQIIPALLVGLLVWRRLESVWSEAAPKPTRTTQIGQIAALARNPVFIGIILMRGFSRMARLVILTFLPVYLQHHLGYSPFWVGFYLMLLYAMGILSQPLLAILSDRIGRKRVLLPSFTILGTLYLLLRIAEPGLQLGLVIAAIGIFFFPLGNVLTAATMEVAASGIQASSFGLASLLAQLMALPAPVLAGFLISSHGIGSIFILSGTLLLSAALMVAFIRFSRKVGT